MRLLVEKEPPVGNLELGHVAAEPAMWSCLRVGLQPCVRCQAANHCSSRTEWLARRCHHYHQWPGNVQVVPHGLLVRLKVEVDCDIDVQTLTCGEVALDTEVSDPCLATTYLQNVYSPVILMLRKQ